MSALNPNIVWAKVDVLTAYQRLTAEIQIRGRLRDTINDPEPLFHLRNVSAEPLVPGAVPLNGVPEGLFNKGAVCGIRTIEPEVPLPEALLETAAVPDAQLPEVSVSDAEVRDALNGLESVEAGDAQDPSANGAAGPA